MSDHQGDTKKSEENSVEQKELKPPKKTPRLKSAPKIRQLYWCDFPEDAQLPEMWKRRPVIILSYRNTLHGICTALAVSTDPQDGKSGQWAHSLSKSMDGRPSWVVCNHIYTFATSRLTQGGKAIQRLDEAEFNAILKLVYEWLPALPPAPSQNGVQGAEAAIASNQVKD